MRLIDEQLHRPLSLFDDFLQFALALLALLGNLHRMLELTKLTALFAVTALAEIVGCYLPLLVRKQGRSAWLLLPPAVSLALFSWLLTHPTTAGRTNAAYAGLYIAVALLWLRLVEGVSLTRWNLAGAAISLIGMTIIAMQPQV